MEEVLHIEDLEWWEEILDAHRSQLHWYKLRKNQNYKDMDYDFFIARKEAHIKEVENKITQIENLKQNVS